MTKNSLLNIAIITSKGIRFIVILSGVIFIGLFIYFQLNKSQFSEFQSNFNTSFSAGGIQSMGSETYDPAISKEETFALSNIETTSMYINAIKILAILVLSYLIVLNFEKIMASVKSLKTFNLMNVKRFRAIGTYAIVLMLLSSYTILRFENGARFKFSISFVSLTIVIISYILAEIFKEGNSLKEENELTI